MKNGFSDVLIGLQYGDEGKAKVIDLIARHYDIIARFNGGANAGHTIETAKGRIALHQIPSGVFYEALMLYIGSGCAINLQKLVDEMKSLDRIGIKLKGRLHISDQAVVIQPHHLFIDELIGGAIGTTKNGIGPAYADRALRMEGERVLSIRLADLLDEPKRFFDYIEGNFGAAQKRYSQNTRLSRGGIAEMKRALAIVAPFIQRDTLFLQKRVRAGKRVLFEGAQSCMLDVGKGLVPYVTSSATVAGSAYVGGDLSPQFHRKTIGVAKAIMSRVGNGPFVSEFGGPESENYCAQDGGNAHTKAFEFHHNDARALLGSRSNFEIGIGLRMRGNEYGTVTGRPRRIGMLDIVQLRHAAQMNGVDEIFLNKCDLLRDFADSHTKKIPLVTGYSVRGKKIDYVPASESAYRCVRPVTQMVDSFTEDIRSCRSERTLPIPLKHILKMIVLETGASVSGIGVGPGRDECVWIRGKG